MPLKRSTKFDLGVEPEVRRPVLKYGAWSIQVVMCMHKLVSFVKRCMTEAISLFSLLHLITILQVILGMVCETLTIIMADEAEIYFRFHNFISRDVYG